LFFVKVLCIHSTVLFIKGIQLFVVSIYHYKYFILKWSIYKSKLQNRFLPCCPFLLRFCLYSVKHDFITPTRKFTFEVCSCLQSPTKKSKNNVIFTLRNDTSSNVNVPTTCLVIYSYKKETQMKKWNVRQLH
jgi:hypothetical protein